MSDHLFIHSDIDDAGLTPAEFRVLAHLSRRAGKNGICHPGIRSISKTCHLSRGTVGTVLESLEKRKFVATSKRHGFLTEYAITTESGIAATVLIQGTPTVLIQGTDCPNPEHGLAQSKARKVIHEGNPLKDDSSPVSPKRPSRPASSRIQIVDDHHISELGKIYTPASVAKAVASCRAWLLTPKGTGKAFSKRRLQTFLRDAEPIGAPAAPPHQSARLDIIRHSTPARIVNP